MVRLSRGTRAIDNHLKPLPPMVRASFLDGPGEGFGGIRTKSMAIDATYVKAHRPAHGGKGANAQAIDKSRGEPTTKIHLPTDTLGQTHTIVLIPGNMSDMNGADLLLPRMPTTRYLIADKSYDADRLRAPLRDCSTVPVIPGRTNRKRKVVYD